MFLIIWLTLCGALAGLVAIAWHYDHIVVFILRAMNAPVYEEARRVAASIYQHPDQWRITGGNALAHATIGKIYYGNTPTILHIDNAIFGKWEPNAIERRIIADAVRWHHRALIRKALS